MSNKYDGIKFYGRDDFSIGWYLEKAEPKIMTFSEDKCYESVNEIIELYNIKELMDLGISLPSWSSEAYEELKAKTKPFMGIVARFFKSISDESFMECVQNVAVGYMDDFWELFEHFKIYNQVTAETFMEYLDKPETVLYKILKHRNIVYAYDEQMASVLRNSEQACWILVSKFLEQGEDKYTLPRSLNPCEFEDIFQKYIESEDASPRILTLIYDAQSTKECPISDKIRLLAKRSFKQFWENPNHNVHDVGYGVRISFEHQDELKKSTQEGRNYRITYDIEWLAENLDYPTILNNFIYIFEMVDLCTRCKFVSIQSKIGVYEDMLRPKGIKFYPKGSRFQIAEMISSAQMTIYYDFLKVHNIDLEAVFTWFFEEYLKNEFAAEGFSMKATSATDDVEKCRTLASEMDGILKQYRMYVRDGCIDRELFEMSSEHLVIDSMPSLIRNKYAYANNEAIQKEINLLFSNQALLSCTEKTRFRFSTLFDLLQREVMTCNDFYDFQLSSLRWLMERGTLSIDEDGRIALNMTRVNILKDLYEKGVLCISYWVNEKHLLEKMRDEGDLRFDDTLFSIPEKNYLNYVLNKAEYSDGLDLRNKYAHSTYPQDKKVQRYDYAELLKVMMLIILKIHEEFCLREILCNDEEE